MHCTQPAWMAKRTAALYHACANAEEENTESHETRALSGLNMAQSTEGDSTNAERGKQSEFYRSRHAVRHPQCLGTFGIVPWFPNRIASNGPRAVQAL